MKHAFINNERAESESLGAILAIIAMVLVAVVYFALIPMIGSKLDTAADLQGDYATGTLTFAGVTHDAELINISTVTYELDTEGNTTAGNVAVPIADTAILTTVTNLTAAVNANATTSAILTATNTSTTMVLTADAVGTAGNVATTETVAYASFGAATMTGGVNADANWVSDDIATGVDLWADVGGMIGIAFIIAIVAVILFMLRREFD